MTILFLYDSPLVPEKGGTERATKLVMDELSRRGHICIGLFHFNQDNPNEYFLNGERVKNLGVFLMDNRVDVVVNQIAFHYWLLEAFLSHGGEEWKKKGGLIISFMHFDPTPNVPPVKFYYRNFWGLSFIRKIKRLGLFFFLPKLRYNYAKTRRYSFQYIYNNSDRYILMSPSYIETFKEYARLKDTDKVSVITNMLTFPIVDDESILRKKEKIVLVVSRLDDNQKRISLIIKMWKNIKDHRGYSLHIVGTGKDEQYLKKLVKSRKDIVFEGQQSPLEWYQKARIFLLASPREGWGLTITESLQNGVVPIVMNTSRVFSDIITNAENGFIANNEKEYTAYLDELLINDKLRNKLARAGLSSVQEFSAKIIGNKWERLLQSFDLPE